MSDDDRERDAIRRADMVATARLVSAARAFAEIERDLASTAPERHSPLLATRLLALDRARHELMEAAMAMVKR